MNSRMIRLFATNFSSSSPRLRPPSPPTRSVHQIDATSGRSHLAVSLSLQLRTVLRPLQVE
jgi:hypothetical protein